MSVELNGLNLGNPTIKYPFRFWCQHVLPLVYDDSLSYYELLCKCVKYINGLHEDDIALADEIARIERETNLRIDELTTALNNAVVEINTRIDNEVNTLNSTITERVTTLQNNINTVDTDSRNRDTALGRRIDNLSADMENYIDGLLDEWASDGTLGRLIDREVFNRMISKSFGKMLNEENKPMTQYGEYIDDIIPIVKCKGTYQPIFEKDDFESKLQNPITKYVNIYTGNDNYGTGESDSPYRSFHKALFELWKNGGGTIEVMSDLFYNDIARSSAYSYEGTNFFSNFTINNMPVRINGNNHKVIMSYMLAPDSNPYSFTNYIDPNTGPVDDVYICTQLSQPRHFTYNNKITNTLTPFEEVTVLDDCITKPFTRGTFRVPNTQTNALFVHMPKGVPINLHDNVIWVSRNDHMCVLENNAYVEINDLIFIGGNNSIMVKGGSTIVCENCKFLFNSSNACVGYNDGEYNKSYYINCEAAYSYTDGFCYYGTGEAVEIKCVGHDNGFKNTDTDSNVCNGSTAHGTYKVCRVMCTYYNNKGGNVADINNVNSTHYNCSAYYSCADLSTATPTSSTHNTGFAIQGNVSTDHTKMYLYDCKAYGNEFDLQNASQHATLTVNNCWYDTTYGTITEQ